MTGPAMGIPAHRPEWDVSLLMHFCGMKFLIIRFSSIGDIVLTTPVIRCLKKQIVTAEVHYLTKASFGPILAANPYIDKVHYLKDDLDAVAEALKLEDFDYVIDLHHNLRTLKVKKALDKKSFSFDKLNIDKWFYTNFKWNRMPEIHIVERYLATLSVFGVRNDGAGLDYFIPAGDQVKETDIPTSHQAGYVGLVIGAALATKKLPFHKLKEICTKARHPLILLGGPEDADIAIQLEAIDPFKIYNACGKFNLNESADLVRRAKLIVTHDTGLMHIAAAFKRPILSVWGNTVPDFGMYPYYGDNYKSAPHEMLEVTGLRCRPCSKIGYKKCPKGHFKCMELQPVDRIVGAIDAPNGRK
jgi:ADP-heptose:LPS heptosyltransferase